jgi:hypothetical protein
MRAMTLRKRIKDFQDFVAYIRFGESFEITGDIWKHADYLLAKDYYPVGQAFYGRKKIAPPPGCFVKTVVRRSNDEVSNAT